MAKLTPEYGNLRPGRWMVVVCASSYRPSIYVSHWPVFVSRGVQWMERSLGSVTRRIASAL